MTPTDYSKLIDFSALSDIKPMVFSRTADSLKRVGQRVVRYISKRPNSTKNAYVRPAIHQMYSNSEHHIDESNRMRQGEMIVA